MTLLASVLLALLPAETLPTTDPGPESRKAAEAALTPIAGSPSPFFLLRLTAFLREAAARLTPRA